MPNYNSGVNVFEVGQAQRRVDPREQAALAALRQFVDVDPTKPYLGRVEVTGASAPLTTDEQRFVRENYTAGLEPGAVQVASAQLGDGPTWQKVTGRAPSRKLQYSSLLPEMRRSFDERDYQTTRGRAENETRFATDEGVRRASAMPEGKLTLENVASKALANRLAGEEYTAGAGLRDAERAANIAEATARGEVAPLRVGEAKADIAAKTAGSELSVAKSTADKRDVLEAPSAKQREQDETFRQQAQVLQAQGKRDAAQAMLGRMSSVQGIEDFTPALPARSATEVIAENTPLGFDLKNIVKRANAGGDTAMLKRQLEDVIQSAATEGVPEEQARAYIMSILDAQVQKPGAATNILYELLDTLIPGSPMQGASQPAVTRIGLGLTPQ